MSILGGITKLLGDLKVFKVKTGIEKNLRNLYSSEEVLAFLQVKLISRDSLRGSLELPIPFFLYKKTGKELKRKTTKQ